MLGSFFQLSFWSKTRELTALAFALMTIVLASGLFFLDPVLNRILHIGLGFLMLFALTAADAVSFKRVLAIFGAVIIIPITAYAYYYYPISYKFAGLPPSTLELTFGVLAIGISLLAAWMMAGISIPLIALFFVLYTLFGEYLPGPFAHAGLNITQIVQALYATSRGIYGSITGVSANYIVLFVVFAAYLSQIGFIDFLLGKSKRFLGKSRGGPAKIAIIASGGLGAVMGTAYGNTASTGAFTIPMMKRTGFSPSFAAAVEATASVGGQFVPPILGGAAFLMVDILGISYSTVMVASIPLAIMFYLSIFLVVDLRAAREGITTTPLVLENNNMASGPLGGWLKLAPVVILIALLAEGFTPQRAGFWAILSILLVDLLENRSLSLSLKHLIQGLIEGAKSSAVIVGIIATAGIIAGLTSTTGLGLVLSQVLTSVAGTNLPLLLVLTAATSIILGLGLPTIVCYLLMAVLVAPALTSAGIEPIVAHLFLIYFASLSSITPPVGPSNFIAASIAGSGAKPMQVGLLAIQLSLPAFIVPFIFVYHPELLMLDGLSWSVAYSLFTALLGVYALAAAQTGMVQPGYPLPNLATRLVVLLCAAGLLWPDAWSDIVAFFVFLGIHFYAAQARNGSLVVQR
ncbi:TRAP transporter permease [Marinobacterium rhizophilum]|uniref:TRAP transporter fused permease subunit n=1 Tax=Marinobacterium rhizophilum TaxID=420402 RepID=A0ABY5HIB0_9GAMM|nr:TRAP transporter fused permease subunit [Marinobacterium rhizophilum]UTW11993.1 TRAP transporter fused permease subunit [Marinobacterium rhizophilum]